MKKRRSDVRQFVSSAGHEQPNRRTLEPPNASRAAPTILALDFDGVICDSVQEGLRSAWRVYRDIWGGAGDGPPPEVAAAYIRLRPSLEIGWEFPVMLRAIVEGVPEADLLREFQTTWRSRVVQAHHLDPGDLSARFDAARDAWIRADPSDWLASQPFYPGVADRLRAILQGDTRLFVITTKEWRYAHLLLERNGVPLTAAHVWGKERARPKADLLGVLRQEHGVETGEIWFVEDRLKTLRAVRQQADLEAVSLFLATWGYNTSSERDEARADRQIMPLTLEQFCGDFPDWMRPEAGNRIPRGVAI
jgi:phosphoglycolate phosphatase-like HAD superfamily hydrolase